MVGFTAAQNTQSVNLRERVKQILHRAFFIA